MNATAASALHAMTLLKRVFLSVIFGMLVMAALLTTLTSNAAPATGRPSPVPTRTARRRSVYQPSGAVDATSIGTAASNAKRSCTWSMWRSARRFRRSGPLPERAYLRRSKLVVLLGAVHISVRTSNIDNETSLPLLALNGRTYQIKERYAIL